MKPLCLFTLTVVVAMCFVSCYGHKKEEEILKGMGTMLENSNRSIENANQTIYRAIDSKLNKPESKDHFAVIFPKTTAVRNASKEMIGFTDEIKSAIKKKTEHTENFQVTYNDEDKSSVKEILTQDKINALFDRLAVYKTTMLHIDSAVAAQFSNNTFFNNVTGTTENSRAEFSNCFNDLPAGVCIAVLNRLENNVYNAESKFITYFHNSIATHTFIRDDFPAMLVSQNSTVFHPGDEIKITGGIGIFAEQIPIILKVNRNTVKGDHGVGTCILTAPQVPGKYKVPVTINFKDNNGLPQTKTTTVEYRVVP